tara:strand:- start:322 stop:561 length:240 start_codon:yes stop_codon:yes gene_type:complete
VILAEYIQPIGRKGARGRCLNTSLYAYLDALDIGETWEISAHGKTERSINRIRQYWQTMRGRALRVHTTSRGFMFVRIE